MLSKPVLSAENVSAIINAAREYAEQNNWKVCIAVADDGGHLLGMLRLDGALPMTATISQGKARVSAIGGRESVNYEEMINNGRYAYLSVPLDTFLEGGVPIVIDNQVVGAVGVSGVKSSDDAQIAKAGIAALG